MAKHRRIKLVTWQQCAELGYTRFCWECPRIYKTEAWALAHLDSTGHPIGYVHLQALSEMGRG